ncbi:TonB-dependent receptor [Novosphingobium guangzhouense]|uniref:TonB-dependent receptor n=1 Tax=Novosphingobium guangzhouense TaxID=1850347 RepID=A0A2K2G106_9SPHN|nr:TonB-dependent receptor [Novosphingobium guangzhouense]PNU04739.1 TonB-dependent receptor [Novosphingobium guangzhouense]
MNSARLRRLTAVSVLAVSASFAAPAMAQDTAPAADGTDNAIVVTALRREERALDVPVAVSTLSGEKLDVLNSSGQDIRFLAARVPSLQIESSFGRTFPRFYIRGLGNTDFSADAAQPVSVVYDNVALESPMLKAFPAFDLENVEVLKGPQGTLFGRNTPAGVVKLTSKRPTEEVDGHVSASWATYNTVNLEAAVGAPLTDKLRFRVAGLVQRRDDWVKNDNADTINEKKFEGYQDYAGRFQLEYEDGPLDILVNAHARSLKGTARVFRANAIKPGTNDLVDGYDIEHTDQNGSNPQELESWGANVQASYEFDGAGSLYSITAWERASVFSRGDIDGGTPLNTPFQVQTGGDTTPKEFSQELRFASKKFGDVSFQAGAYYFNQNLESESGSWNNDNAYTPTSVSHLDNETYAFFGSVEYTPVDALILRGGVRWSHDKRRAILVAGDDITDADAATSIGRTNGSKWSWDGSATFKLSSSSSIYARVASGYLGAALKNDTAAGVATMARPQTTTSYEVGFKTEQPGLFNFSVDGYYFDTKNIQLTAVGGGSNVTQLMNAKKAVGYGVEAEFSATPIENLVLTLGGSYNHTELKDKNLYVAPCGGGCTVTDPLVTVDGTTLASIDGNPLPQAPRWIANATLRYAVPLGNDNEIFAYTDWSYRSKINLFLYDSIEFTGKAFLEGGARIGYRDNKRGYEVAAFARNITNQIRVVGAIDFNNLTAMLNEPRIIGGEFRFNF